MKKTKVKKKTMTYDELMNKCAGICRRYKDEGNAYLGVIRAREYCVRHVEECSDITEEQLESIKNMDEYAEYQQELENEKRKKKLEKRKKIIKENRTNYPDDYKLYLKLKRKFEL